jgi:hypothetical protein
VFHQGREREREITLSTGPARPIGTYSSLSSILD